MAESDNGQQAIVQELLRRRDSLDPEKQAIVDELSRRFNLPPPAMNKVPIPEGLQPQSYGERVMSNLPGSAERFIKNAPLAPSAGPRPVQDAQGNWSFPPISLSDELGGILSGIGNMVLNPSESFAQDPVGTVAIPAMLAYGGYRGVTSPAVKAGAKEAIAEVKKELPSIKKWERNATIGGMVLGGSGGHPFIGSEVGAAAGATRAIPPMVRGFRRGYSQYQPLPELSPLPVPATATPSERFTPGQYDAPRQTMPPVPVGGAHIPDYVGPVATPLPDVAPATPAVEPIALYNQIAKSLGGKDYATATPKNQAAIRTMAAKIDPAAVPMPAPPGTLPTPGVSEAYKASVPQVSIIPEGEHNIIRRVAETNRGAKDTAIARNLKDEGFTAEKLDQMSDAELAKRVKDLGYRPSTGKNYSRTWQAFRRDLRSLLD